MLHQIKTTILPVNMYEHKLTTLPLAPERIMLEKGLNHGSNGSLDLTNDEEM